MFNTKKEVIGVEALLRVQGSDGLSIPPAEFFQNGEHSLVELLNLDRLTRVLHALNFANSRLRTKRLFLNLLPIISQAPTPSGSLGFAHWNQMVKTLGIQNSQISYEMVNLARYDNQMLAICSDCIRAADHNIAIQYLGLTEKLHELFDEMAPHILKIDKSLLQRYMQGDKQPIMDAIDVAKHRNYELVVEGIETEEQFVAMQGLPIDLLQGYWLHQPQAIKPLYKQNLSERFSEIFRRQEEEGELN